MACKLIIKFQNTILAQKQRAQLLYHYINIINGPTYGDAVA